MYRNKVQTENLYRTKTLSQSIPQPTTANSKCSTYELLWRKKSSKVHKTWEGDALGYLKRTAGGLEMIIEREKSIIASIKLKPETSLPQGSILSSGSFDFEVGVAHTSGKPKPSTNNELPDTKRRCDRSSETSLASSIASSPPLFAARQQLSPPLSRKYKSDTRRSAHSPPRVAPTIAASTSLPSQSTSVDSRPRILGMVTPFKSPLTAPKCINSTSPRTPGDIDPILKAKLRPHQLEGLQFMRDSVLGVKHSYGNGCILADDMGLGKTLTSIALIHTLLRHRDIQNALIVCPVSLIANWRNEFSKWLPSNEHIRPQIGVMTVDQNGLGNGALKDPVRSFFGDRNFKTHQIMIVGYERLRLLSGKMSTEGKSFDLVICDEGHRLKSPGSKTTEALLEISGDKRIILTGTPIQNELSEFRALANFVNPGCLGSEAKFERKFADPIRNYTTIRQEQRPSSEEERNDYDAAFELMSSQDETGRNPVALAAQEAIAELTEICEEFMLRRTSKVLESYLAVPRTEVVVFCRPTEAQESKYKGLVYHADELVRADQMINQGACLQALSELKKAAAGDNQDKGGKIMFLSLLLDAIRDQTDDEKVVIASGSTRVLDLCQQVCANKKLAWLRLDGSTPQDKRQSSVTIFNKFSRNQAFVFLLSTRSGGTGLNLIGASRLVLMDCDWNPAIDAQVMARIHRDGQTKACYIYRLLTTGTVDEKIFQRQLSKAGLSENVLLDVAGTTKAEFSLETLHDLFTFTTPAKCNTLDTTGRSKGGLKQYEEDNTVADVCLQQAVSNTKLVSCILRRKTEPAS